MSDYLERSKQLLGDEKINSLGSKTILIAGVGGVGGTALEALARSGFKKFILIDFDDVSFSNINRQILFTCEDIGKSKVEIAKEHLRKIDRAIEVEMIKSKIEESNFSSLVTSKIDFIVDAIDSVNGKLDIYEYALKNNVPFISSLGMGNRLDPEKVFITKLSKTENDPLARKIRAEGRKRGLNLDKIPVVCSKETPLFKSSTPASMIMVPSTAGLIICKYILTTIK